MKAQAELRVETIGVDELVPYEGNAKLHPSKQVRQIGESIREFDFSDPVAAWHDDEGRAVVVEGHGRLMAARELGIRELPVIFLDYMSDEQRRAYSLVHNQLTMVTGFDQDALRDELEGITSIDMGAFGLSAESEEEIDIDALFESDGQDGPEEKGGREPRTMTCPHCGEEFEL